VRELLIGIADTVEGAMTDPAPRVVVKNLNDYNVEVELQLWIRDEQQHVAQRFALREKIYETLSEAGVEMPFETIQMQPIEVRTAG
jgi:small conductance mechanosensitive channel